MGYYSAKEVAEKWNISKRRVTTLASQGRIPGAVLVGKSWMIPVDAEKPEDGRKKPEPESAVKPEERYCFPYIIFAVHSEEQVEKEFTDEERLLYQACRKFEAGEFTACRTFSEALLNSENRYIRMGALYLNAYVCIEVFEFDKAHRFIDDMAREEAAFDDWPLDVRIMIREFDTFYSGFDRMTEIIKDYLDIESVRCVPYLYVSNVLNVVFRLDGSEIRACINAFELECLSLEAQGYSYAAMYMHFYIGLMHSYLGNDEMLEYHVVRSAEIALKEKTYFSLSTYMQYTLSVERIIRANFPKESADILFDTGRKALNANTAFIAYASGTQLLKELTEKDFLLISYILQNYSNEEIAQLEGYSTSTIKRRLHSLFGKLEVKNKKELIEKYMGIVRGNRKNI